MAEAPEHPSIQGVLRTRGEAPASPRGFPSMADAHIQLEGRLAALTLAAPAYEKLTRALKSGRWQGALVEELDALQSAVALEAKVQEGLTALSARALGQGWSDDSEPVKFLARFERLRAALEKAALRRAPWIGRERDLVAQLRAWQTEVGSRERPPLPDDEFQVSRGTALGAALGSGLTFLPAAVMTAMAFTAGVVPGLIVMFVLGATLVPLGLLMMRSCQARHVRVFRDQGAVELWRGDDRPQRKERTLTLGPTAAFRIQRREGGSDEVIIYWMLSLRTVHSWEELASFRSEAAARAVVERIRRSLPSPLEELGTG